MKYIWGLFFLVTSIIGYSQDEKPLNRGNKVLGGGASLGSESNHYSYSKSFNGTLNPSFGYFIADGLILGLSPSLSINYKFDEETQNLYACGLSP